MRALGLAVASLALAGCMGIPSALAPGFEGSVGLPHSGVVTGAVALPKQGRGYERYRDDGVYWGTPRLVSAIQRAAASVAIEAPGAPLVIGDLSEQFGGKTDRHRSHRSGRDVDILFYVTTPSGVSVKSPGFITFAADGLATASASKGKGKGKAKGARYLRFDVERMWLLVKALVSDPETNVQWIFISWPLEGLVTEYARALGEDPEIIWHAEVVMKQPSDSAKHDDHIHVRLACSEDDLVHGCDGGPRWDWQDPPEVAALSDEQKLAAILAPL
ncbi:MAG: penicillin-insensitive murein endopeptidase [Polyangiaceae bacterium]